MLYRELDARKDEKDSILSDKVAFTGRARSFGAMVLALFLCACASGTVLLNSERIERQFGSYGIDVLSSDDGVRRANLYSTEDGQRVCRTYAVVRFTTDIDKSYAAMHERVLAGESLGKVFKENGWSVQKRTVHISSIESSQLGPQISELMRLPANHTLAMHIYQLSLSKGVQTFDYATIIETHHPDYLSTDDLQSIYLFDTEDAISGEAALQLVQLMLVDSNT
jgi:hypothetical protein